MRKIEWTPDGIDSLYRTVKISEDENVLIR